LKIAMMTDSYYPTRDGVVTSLTITKTALEAMGHEVVVIAPDPGEADRMGGVVYFPAVQFRSYPGYFLPVLRSNKIEILKKIDPDVIHIHGIAIMAFKAMICARELHLPTVLTFHTMVDDTVKYYSPLQVPEDFMRKLVWIYLRSLIKRPDAIIVPTPSTEKALRDNGAHPREVRVIPTGLDTNRFSPEVDGSHIRERHGLVGRKVLIHVGRVSFEKDIGTVVKALPLLDDDVVLLIAGKGPALDDIKALVSETGVADRTVFAGFVPDEELPSYYAAADVAISASRFETQGLSVMEAMSMCKPVVCAAARAFLDFVKDGENGFLFDGGPEECADAVRRALSAPSSVQAAARSTAEEFSIPMSAKKHLEAYAFAVESKRKREEEKG
jgi:1,2-diacylglycerol 3-alpha-glucosyltransferase